MTLTGDPRRWANEPGIVGVVRYPDTHRWGEAEPRPVGRGLQGLEDVIRYEGAHTIAAVFLETIVGTNGILIPPDGYIQGVREICDRNDILMVADEVMAGFGRTGKLVRDRPLGHGPRPHDDGQGPDLVVPAPRGGRDAPAHRRGVRDEDVLRRPDLLAATPSACAAALATIGVYEEDGLHRATPPGMGAVMRGHHERLAAKHPSVGAHRNLGLFGIIDLVRSRDPWTPDDAVQRDVATR